MAGEPVAKCPDASDGVKGGVYVAPMAGVPSAQWKDATKANKNEGFVQVMEVWINAVY